MTRNALADKKEWRIYILIYLYKVISYGYAATMKNNKFLAFLTIFLIAQQMQAVFSQNACLTGTYPLYSDTIDAIHYGIHLTNVDLTTKTIKGYTVIRCTPRIEPVHSIKLELVKLIVDSAFIGNSKVAGYTHSGSILTIPLAAPVWKTDTLTVTVYYHGQPFVDPSGWGGFQFSGDYAFNLGVGFDAIPHNLGKAWFPCLDDFHDRALYDVYITVPATKKAISGGILREVQDNGDNTSTWHWKTSFTLPTYLISATIGNYSLVNDTFDGANGAVPVTFYCRPSDTARVANTFVHLKDILHIYEDHFGAYPFERVGYSATAQGAMEHAANISYPYSGWNGNTANEWWYAHELSHMWFGDKVTCASAEDMWLNEGWAVWCESLFQEYLYGREQARSYTRSKLKDVLQFTHTKDGGYYALYGIPQSLTYGNTVYEKGGQVVHTLRHYLCDSLFFGGIKAYLQQFGYQYASTCDLRDFLSNYSGVNLDDFFEAWVFSPGFPNFSVDYMSVNPAQNGYEASVFVKQKLKGTNRFANSNHLEITFMGADWQQFTDTIIFSGQQGSKTFYIPFEPMEVMADFNEKISDAAIAYAATIKTTGEKDFPETFAKVITTQVSDSAFVRIVHNWVAPDSLKVPQPGLRLSDSRYWKVEGIMKNDFTVKGKFFYSKSNNLDNTLLTGPKDSIVMLYRPDARYDWRGTGFTRQGTSGIGYITVDSLQRGEYTLAVWDKTFSINEPVNLQDKEFRIYPNPSHGRVTVELDVPYPVVLGIYDSTGKKLDEISFPEGKHETKWHKQDKVSGVCYFRLSDSSGKEMFSRKVIFN